MTAVIRHYNDSTYIQEQPSPNTNMSKLGTLVCIVCTCH